MKRILNRNPISKCLRRSQRGQSIILLAFAFIALLAFVGLVTDVSLMFVRYAALRRAVDAAAIAAAGQIREGTDYADITVAAQEYIELHGLETSSVLVETCETDIYQWRLGLGPWEGAPHPDDATDAFGNYLYRPVSAAMPETELCNWDDPHKLVRVSAQIKSPTTFLALIGIKEFTLEATSVSETAVLDIALVIDTSESMSTYTTLTDFTRWNATAYGSGGPLEIRAADCIALDEYGQPKASQYKWGGCCNDAGTGNVGDGSTQSNGVVVPNGLIWHDMNGNGMYDGTFENGLLNTVKQSGADPNYTTLVCNPFKDVKDAARAFIRRLDFVRGDRVVLVTFDREAKAYDPDGEGTEFRPLIRDKATAVETLNADVGIYVNESHLWSVCLRVWEADIAWQDWLHSGGTPPEPATLVHPQAYESIASCGETNIGGGLLKANDALTNPMDVRREAIWVIILLTDGAANATDKVRLIDDPTSYGYWGYCPWWTFCNIHGDDTSPYALPTIYHWPQCTENNPAQDGLEPIEPFCNDYDPNSRHFCLDWSTGLPRTGPEGFECTYQGHYDADDYARDMADFAGLIEVAPNKPGNFIAMFAIGFGPDIINDPTAAPLLRYIADAGDNGFIDNDYQQALRPLSWGGAPPTDLGSPDVCEPFAAHPETQCGQYYYVPQGDLGKLQRAFEDIASRLFTRLSR